jgi:hypothetical protein
VCEKRLGRRTATSYCIGTMTIGRRPTVSAPKSRHSAPNGADLCGIDRALFFDPRTPAAWEYVYPPGSAPWVCGATLCYRREYWRANPFVDASIGEDTRFAAAVRPGRLHVLRDNRFFVALVHAANTSPKQVRDPRWRPYEVAAVRALTGSDWPQPETVRPFAPSASAIGCQLSLEKKQPNSLRCVAKGR